MISTVLLHEIIIIRAPWDISNDRIHKKLNIPTVDKEVQNIISNYKICISNHSNPTAYWATYSADYP